MRKFIATSAPAIFLALVGCQSTPAPTTQPIATTNPTTQPMAHRATTNPAVVVAPTTPPPAAPPPPAVVANPPASQPLAQLPAVTPVPGVVAQKPFIKWPTFDAFQPQPSTLLTQHARGDSPIPLSQYADQPTHSLDEFPLSRHLSAAQLQKQFGPPAQLADYSDQWMVYRLTLHRELWLHFTQPDENRLTAAEVIAPIEDGYTRQIVFPVESNH